VLASAVDPGHPQWAGRERGWPVPSQAYRLKMWERDMEELRIGEQGLIRQLGPRTDKDYEESWAIDIRYGNVAEFRDFTGPADPRYREHKRLKAQEMLEEVRRRIKYYEERKP
ncbi:hypothetical protein, partial [Pseudothauera lacus]